jgi:hypothetical protein
MVFCVIITEIFTSWVPMSNCFWRTLSVSQWYLMSTAFDLFCFIVSFKIAEGRWGLYVAQFSECDSEWGSTLGVVKARSYF